jgi:hypothetical protein
MGHSLSWLAVTGLAPALVLDTLQLARTGETSSNPGHGIHCTVLPGGAFLLHVDDAASRLTAVSVLASLSAKAHVVACRMEEGARFSAASCYRGGKLLWSVEHDARQDLCHLAIAGEAPPMLAALRARALADHADGPCGDADVDTMFGVPLDLAHMTVSYAHVDEHGAPQAYAFERLEPLQPLPDKPWWKWW